MTFLDSEGYNNDNPRLDNEDNDNPGLDNENNEDNDNSGLDNENNEGNDDPDLDNENNEDNDNPGLDNEDYDDEINNTETESDCSKTSKISLYNSEEYDESTEDKEFDESKMANISDSTVDAMFVNCDLIIIIITDIYLF
jgi:hypothetical protein